MTKRKYSTDEKQLSLIQEYRLSGLTDKQWCETHQICLSNFYYQIQKFCKRAREIPESHSKTTLTTQKQDVVHFTFTFQYNESVTQCSSNVGLLDDSAHL